MTIGRARELIRKQLAQKNCLEFLRNFPGTEFKSFVNLGYDHIIHQTIKTLNKPKSTIKIDAGRVLIMNWFLKQCEPLRDSRRIFLSVHDFVEAGWAEVSMIDMFVLWDIWEKSEDKCLYVIDDKNNIFKFFEKEYECEFFQSETPAGFDLNNS